VNKYYEIVASVRVKARDAMRFRWVAVVVWVLYGISALAMFGWPGLTGAVARACQGRSPLDVRSFWNAADARDLIAACGSEGRAAYLRLELLDLVYPLLGGLALLLAASLLIRRLPGRRWRLLLIPAIAMTVLDYGENAAVWSILSTWPAVGDLAAQLGGATTLAKRAAGLAAYLVVPLLLLAIGLDRLRVRVGFGDRTQAGAGASSLLGRRRKPSWTRSTSGPRVPR
jgi:hypothetical protein